MDELPHEVENAVCALARMMWRPGGSFDRSDLEQEARVIAAEAVARHDGRTFGLKSYALTAVRWRIADLYRHDAHEPRPTRDPGYAEQLAEEDAQATEEAECSELRAQVGWLLAALPTRQRRVVISVYLLDQPLSVVAADLGIEENAVKAIRHRALENLRRLAA